MLVVPYGGSVAVFNQFLSQFSVYYHLYINDLTPTLDSVLSDFVEASYPSYGPQIVQQWTDAVLVGGVAATYGDPLLWTVGSVVVPQTVYGYYVTGGPTGPLLWAELRELGPVPLDTVGARVYLTPALTLQSLTA